MTVISLALCLLHLSTLQFFTLLLTVLVECKTERSMEEINYIDSMKGNRQVAHIHSTLHWHNPKCTNVEEMKLAIDSHRRSRKPNSVIISTVKSL